MMDPWPDDDEVAMVMMIMRMAVIGNISKSPVRNPPISLKIYGPVPS